MDGSHVFARAIRDRIGSGPLRILIVEDEPLLAMDMEMQLTDLGHEIVGTARTAGTAEAAAQELLPDVVIMDLRLAKSSSGEEAARTIYCRFGIRSIFTSGSMDEATRIRLSVMRPVAILPKPVMVEQLASALRRVCPPRRDDFPAMPAFT